MIPAELFNKKNICFSLALGLPYSVILIFSAYGPALHFICGSEQNIYLSSLFLVVLLISMILPDKISAPVIAALSSVSAVILALFPILSLPWQSGVFVFLGWTEGRIAALWSKSFITVEKEQDRIFILTSALSVAYFLLYTANAAAAALKPLEISIASSILLLLSIPFLTRISASEKKSGHISSNLHRRAADKPRLITRLLLIIFIIYITAGFTYTVVFPTLRNQVEYYRYFNVLPFVLSLPAAGFLLYRYGAKIVLHLGITFLALSYLMYQLPLNIRGYFLIESLIQPGWAFLDLFVWYIGAYLARRAGKSIFLPVFIAVFLLGTVCGAVLSVILERYYSLSSVVFMIFSLLPLIIVIPALNSLQISFQKRGDYSPRIPRHLLTPREYEIAHLLAENRTQSEICGEIHISINTLKSHTRNIYRKLEISSKKELIRQFGGQS